MQAHLDHLDARGFELRLDKTVCATLGATTGLRGHLVHDVTHTAAENVAATRAELTSLQLQFTTTRIVSDAPIVFDELRGSLERDGSGANLRCELQASRAEGMRLQLVIGELALIGRVVLTDARLVIDGDHGALSAGQVLFTELTIEGPRIKVSVDNLTAAHLAIEWGPSGLRVRSLNASLGVVMADVTLPVPSTEPPLTEAPPSESSGWISRSAQELLPLLEGVSGQLDLDLGLDLTVPVLGRRRATHQFRLAIDQGTINYEQLEHGLSHLEDALLDFSLRDDVLVLEMGIPLLPTRGRGKPIVLWDVSGADLPLAQANRVRLANLAQFRMASDDRPSTTDDGASDSPSVVLRELSFRPLVASLRFAHETPPAILPLRAIGELVVRADLHHAVETEARDGTASARITDLVLGALRVPAGRRVIQLGAARLDGGELEGTFAGMQPRTLHATLRGLSIEALDFSPAG